MLNTYHPKVDKKYQEKFNYYRSALTKFIQKTRWPGHFQLDGDHSFASIWNKSYRNWEYPYLIAATEPKENHMILDVGGNNSPFAWFIAQHFKCEVHGLDPLERHHLEAIQNIEFHKKNNTGLKYKSILSSMENYNPKETYDIVYSVSVIEHVLQEIILSATNVPRKSLRPFWSKVIPTKEQWEMEQKFVRNMSDVLKPGGILAITYDIYPYAIGGASLRSKQDVIDRIVNISGLKILEDDIEFSDKSACGIIILKK